MILDNPVWNALNSGNQPLSHGDDRVNYFDDDVSPFVGMNDYDVSTFEHLAAVIPSEKKFAIFSTNELEIPAPWNVTRYIKVFQMLYDHAGSGKYVPALAPVHLQEKDVPEMLALAKLTNPGPFLKHTIRFGDYYGIFQEDKLVAMAGERMYPLPFREISAVCTHPDFVGKGYAGSLIAHLVGQIRSASGIPFLHVKRDNDHAIRLYEHSGFTVRKPMHIYTLQRDNP